MSQSHKQSEHPSHIFTPGQQQQHTGSKDASQAAGHDESNEQIRVLAHHIVSTTPETDLPNLRTLLTQHPTSKHVLEQWYKHYRGEALPQDEKEKKSEEGEDAQVE